MERQLHNTTTQFYKFNQALVMCTCFSTCTINLIPDSCEICSLKQLFSVILINEILVSLTGKHVPLEGLQVETGVLQLHS